MMTKSERLNQAIDRIESAGGQVASSAERPFRLEHHALGGIATDSRIPTLTSWATAPGDWMTNIEGDPDQVAEAEYVRSLYEGCTFGEGQRREQEFRRMKEQAVQIARATKGGRRG